MTAQNAILTPWGRAQTKFMELAKTEGNPNTITRHEFQEALSYVGIQESDQEILDRLFTMFDKMGDNQVPHPGATVNHRIKLPRLVRYTWRLIAECRPHNRSRCWEGERLAHLTRLVR